MGGILTLSEFLNTFPLINPNAGISPEDRSTRSTYQGILPHSSSFLAFILLTISGVAVASYNLGCFLGAVITIFIGNPLGRKKIIMLGTAIMVVGAILQASATTLPHFIVGRIITGIGNRGNTSTIGSLLFSCKCSYH